MLVRVEEHWPGHDPQTNQKFWVEINKMAGQTHVISDTDKQRHHPSMHRNNTLDVISVLRGEVYLVLEDDEILLKPTDTVIIQGTNHGWSNRGNQPCLLTDVRIDAIPRQ
jgi:quercetin dioxygenase-like cupin family protein